MFAVVDGAAFEIGDEGQRLAMFVCPESSAGAHHGFPVFSDDKKPDPGLLDRWVESGVIDHSARMKIEKGKL
jgi:hypothetical protein